MINKDEKYQAWLAGMQAADKHLRDAIRQHINLPDADFKQFMIGFIDTDTDKLLVYSAKNMARKPVKAPTVDF